MIAPSTGTAVRGGLTYREAHFVAEAIAETNQLVSLDLVEVNPVLEGSENDVSRSEPREMRNKQTKRQEKGQEAV